jgi:hypothetical protein
MSAEAKQAQGKRSLAALHLAQALLLQPQLFL